MRVEEMTVDELKILMRQTVEERMTWQLNSRLNK